MIISGIAIAWYTEKLSENEIPPLLKKHHEIFRQQSEAAQQTLTHGGIDGLLSWTASRQNTHAIENIYIIDDSGMELTRQPLPQDITRFISSGFNIHFNTPFDATMDRLLGYRVIAPDNKSYRLVTAFNKPHPIAYLLTPQRIIIGILVSGLICFALAAHLSAPIKHLRQAAMRLSQGDLDARISDTTRNRHDEIGALASDFNIMADRLQTMINLQKHLMRDISHELRSPLARIQVALELARQRNPSADHHELQRIELELERLNNLIDELLTFVRMETDQSNIETQNINLAELLHHIVEDSRFENCQSPQHTPILIDCPAHVEIAANPPLLHRALENIIRNACFYTAAGTTVNITCGAVDGNLLLTVQDEGPGVPDDMLDKIFQPFSRVSKSREKNSGGYGIGLAISKRAIEIHGGRIHAENNATGKGLSVLIILPMKA